MMCCPNPPRMLNLRWRIAHSGEPRREYRGRGYIVVGNDLEADARRLISELSERSGRSATQELHHAVRSYYRSLIGDATSPQVGMPFHKMYSDLDADVVLRQSTPTEFIL